MDLSNSGVSERYAWPPSTSSKPATAAKNDVRRQVWRTVRPIAMQINRNHGISDARKLAIGIKPLNFRGSPIKPPDRAQTYHHADYELITFVQIAMRHVFTVPHKAKNIGKMATYFARWATRRGLTSPWSGSVSMGIV